jgi:hypothetical protein
MDCLGLGYLGLSNLEGLNGLGLETWLVWIDWVWGSKLFLSLDLNSLSLSLSISELIAHCCRWLLGSPSQASPSSRICLVPEKMKLKFGSLITYSSQQANWFDFCWVPD